MCRLSAFWLGRDPSTFYRWWTAKAVVLFGIRYLIYQVRAPTMLPGSKHDVVLDLRLAMARGAGSDRHPASVTVLDRRTGALRPDSPC